MKERASQRTPDLLRKLKKKKTADIRRARERFLTGWHVESVRIIRPLEGIYSRFPGKKRYEREYLVAKVSFKPERIAPGSRRTRICVLKGIEDKPEKILGIATRMRHLRSIGLPVPHAGVVVVKGKHYLAMEPFIGVGKKTKLISVNEPGHMYPENLGILKISENRALIENLGKDLATLFNHNYAPEFVDFWAFYRKANGKLDRVIHDVEFLKERPWKGLIKTLIKHISACMGEKEFTLFKESFNKHYEGHKI